jgi:pimeloyl-ACP methyl ester carboxylesterase
MRPGREITWLDSEKNRRRFRGGFFAVLAVLLAVEWTIPKHGHFPWEEAPGFYAAYGFIGCVGLIFVAKLLRRLVRRREGYYD